MDTLGGTDFPPSTLDSLMPAPPDSRPRALASELSESDWLIFWVAFLESSLVPLSTEKWAELFLWSEPPEISF